MLSPRYTITGRLLDNIKRINSLVNKLNNRRFSKIITLELEKTAYALSSHASTSIEGNPLPLTEVKKILKSQPQNLRQSEQEVINYNQALKELDTLLKKGEIKLSPSLILIIHKRVMQKILPSWELGRWREKPVVVNDPRTGKVVYLPPEAQDIRPLMENLVVFVNEERQTIDPLIMAGIFHKQMVIIHPFMDGNGRTTRLVTKALLADMGLDTFNLFSFENYYNKNVTRYFQTVGEFGNYYELAGKIDFTFWLEYFTEGIIDELWRVEKLLPKISLSPETELKPHHLKIISFIQKKGFITDNDYASLTNRAKATRTKDLNKLIDLDMVERRGKGRATYYVLKER